MNAIEVKNLNKYFHVPTTLHVLKDLSFEISKNKLTSITGKSGSGKSTLLYLLSTMDTEYDGTINLNGINIGNKSKNWLANFRNEQIGFIFQFHYLLPEFTVLDNIMLPALKLGKLSKDEIKEEAIRLLHLLDLEDQYQKKASLLSGGQQQRVAIARALINKPAFIIGDEPTGNLDSKNALIILDLFQKLCHEDNQTILVVTHDDDFARKTDSIIHLKDGYIIE